MKPDTKWGRRPSAQLRPHARPGSASAPTDSAQALSRLGAGAASSQCQSHRWTTFNGYSSAELMVGGSRSWQTSSRFTRIEVNRPLVAALPKRLRHVGQMRVRSTVTTSWARGLARRSLVAEGVIQWTSSLAGGLSRAPLPPAGRLEQAVGDCQVSDPGLDAWLGCNAGTDLLDSPSPASSRFRAAVCVDPLDDPGLWSDGRLRHQQR